MKIIYTDEQLLEMIRSGSYQREKALKYIFQDTSLKNSIAHMITANKGNSQDGEDMFQEGLIVLDRNIREDKFRGDSKISVYLTSICKFLWMNELRKDKRITLTDNDQDLDQTYDDNPSDILLKEEQKALLKHLLQRLGDRCKKILELWQLSYSMEEIGDAVGLSSPQMARKLKHQCYQKLLEMIQNDDKISSLLKK